MRENIFKNEHGLSKAISQASKLLSSKKRIIHSVMRAPFYNDEPKLFSYIAILKSSRRSSGQEPVDEFAGGTSLIQKNALMKSLGEAIERYCLSVYRKNLIKASYKEVKDRAIDPFRLINFTSEQLKKKDFKDFVFTKTAKFKWVKGYSLLENKKVLIPAQLVYVPYKYNDEKIIRLPITTGAACSTSLGGAIYRGICEAIERDAFMITYLNKLTRDKIDLKNSGARLKELADIYQRYNLELHVVDITTDIKIPVMLGILIDYTGLGPAVSLGLSADINPLQAAISAAEEAQHSRPWIRSEMEKKQKKIDVCTLEGRGLYWADVNMIPKIKFLFSGKTKSLKNKQWISTKYTPQKLKKTIRILDRLGYEILFVETTTEDVKKASFRVVKVIIPQLQPLYLDECLPYLGGKRLYEVPLRLGLLKRKRTILNSIPHPFL